MLEADFEAAWALSDADLAARDPATRDDPSRPYHERWVWDGRPLAGRHVLVRCYHGLGDTIQFARFLPELARRAASVTLEVQPALALLLRHLPLRLHPFDPANPLPPQQADIEIMELSHALRARPKPAPYLHADPISTHPIGLCIQGGGWDPARDIPLALLHSFTRRHPILSLQPTPLPGTTPLPPGTDIPYLARLIAGLDCVVTIDTMVAHLAAALGRPTIVLLKHAHDWRWGSGPTCVWYGDAHPLRQPAPHDWSAVVDALELCLETDVLTP